MAYKDKEKGYWGGETRIKTWTGEVKKRKQCGFKTKREAVEWENTVKSQANPSMEMKFEDFVSIYFRDKEMLLKERSVKNKRYMMERHIIPYFKGKRMNDISAQDLILWQKEMLRKGYSETYLRMIQNQITAVFTHASRIYDLQQNLCKKVTKIGKSDICRLEFWTMEEYEKFINSLETGTRYYVLFEILFWTGCRIGERLALTPNDFEFDKRIMHITKTYYRHNGEDVITAPKTEQSVREVVIPQFLSDEVKDFIERKYAYPMDARIFPIGQEAAQYKLKSQIERIGVPKIPVHGLRHSATAYLISQGIQPMVIKERLGHKDIRITLNTYGHLYPNQQRQVADMLNKNRKKDIPAIRQGYRPGKRQSLMHCNSQLHYSKGSVEAQEFSGETEWKTILIYRHIYGRIIRYGIPTESTNHRRIAVFRNVFVCRSTEGGKVIFYGTAGISCKQRTSLVGISSASGNSALSGTER